MCDFGKGDVMVAATDAACNLSTPYRPIAIYLRDSDSIEYVRSDGPCVHRRIDELLTLVLDMHTRDPIGFRLKGFRKFYLTELQSLHTTLGGDFIAAVSVLERAMTKVGARVLGQIEAYKTARDIAFADSVRLDDLPEAA